MFRPLAILLVLCCAAGAPLHAQTAPAQTAPARADVAARQAAALFVASCVAHASNPAALRAWAGAIGLPALPEPGQAGFLKGAAGIVYDASNPAGKYVLIAHDDGACLVVAETVNTAALVNATQAVLAQAAITAGLENEQIDPGESGMRHRTYQAMRGGRALALVISVGARPVDQAMLSAVSR